MTLCVADKHLSCWSLQKSSQLVSDVLKKFSLSSDDCDIKIFVNLSHRANLEFECVLKREFPSVLTILENLQFRFFDIEIKEKKVKIALDKT